METDIFRLLRPDDVVARWGELRDLLRPAVEKGSGEADVDDIRSLVLSGRMFVFVLEADGRGAVFAVTAEFVVYPRMTVMVVGYGAGQGAAAHRAAIYEGLSEFARRAGATRMRTYCRDSSVARLDRRLFGAEQIYTVMECTL